MIALPAPLAAQPAPAEPPAAAEPPSEPAAPPSEPAPPPSEPAPAPSESARQGDAAPSDGAEPPAGEPPTEGEAPPASAPAAPAPEAPSAEPPPPDAEPPAPPPAPPAEGEVEIEIGVTPASAAPPPAAAAGEAEADAEQEVTVAGTRISQVAGSAYVIKSRQLERFKYDNPLSIVTQAPGVYVRGEDGMGLRPNIGIRGVNPDRSKKITLMEDGILFGPAPYSAPAAYYFPLMSRMTQVRVIKGPGAIAFGPQTVGGAIDFSSRSIPSSTSGALELGAGQYGYQKAHAYFGSSDEQVGFLVEGVHLRDTGFKELPSDADTGSTRNDWMVKGSYVLDPRAENQQTFGLKLAYADEVSNETYLGLSDEDFREDPYQRYAASALDQMKNHRTSIVLSHQIEVPSRSLQLKTQVYRHDYKRIWRKANMFRGSGAGQDIASVLADPDSPTNAPYYAVLTGESDSATPAESIMVGPNDRTFVSQGIQAVLQAKPKTGPLQHSYEAGVRLHNDSIKRRHSQTGFYMVGGELVPDGTPEQVTAANLDETYALAVHMTDAITWRRLTVTPGVRAEFIASESENFITGEDKQGSVIAVMPGAGVFYALTDYLGVLSGVYRGFSPPAPGEKKPEYSVNYETGVRASAAPARAEVIAFYNDYSNITDHCTLASGCSEEDLDRQFNGGAAHIWGFEASAEHEVPVGPVRFPFTVAYTYTRAEFDSTFKSEDPIYQNPARSDGEVQKGDEMPYVPRHQLNASLGIENDRAGGVVGVNYVAAMREEAGTQSLDEVLSTDEQLWLDVGARYKVLKPLTLLVNVRNVLGAQDIVGHRPYGARPNAPRWVQVGAKLEF
jgi:Fe(3+) dicitrate transport protein